MVQNIDEDLHFRMKICNLLLNFYKYDYKKTRTNVFQYHCNITMIYLKKSIVVKMIDINAEFVNSMCHKFILMVDYEDFYLYHFE